MTSIKVMVRSAILVYKENARMITSEYKYIRVYVCFERNKTECESLTQDVKLKIV